MMNMALVMPVRLFGRMEGFLHSWGCFRFFLLALLLCSPAVVFSQQRWERAFGGAGEDYGNSVQQTQDGGYIVAGHTASFGNNWQVYLIKTNAEGDTLWTRNYGGANSDYSFSVQQTLDGGYIVTGFIDSYGGHGNQVYLIKTNAGGDTLWTRTYGGVGFDRGYSVQQTQEGGYIVAGMTSLGNDYQVYLIKTNATGDTLWSRNYGGSGSEEGWSVQQTRDSGYIIAGNTNSFRVGYYDVYLIKTNALGDSLWTRTYEGASYAYGYSVQQTQDGGYIVGGWTNSLGNSDQVYIIKTNAGGDTLWTRTYGEMSNDYGYSVQQTRDGGYIVGGYSNSFGNNYQVYLIKTNAGGDTLWTRTYGGASFDRGYSVQQTQDGGYIVAGHTSSFGNYYQVYLIKTDANGNVGVEDNSPGRIKPLTSNLSFSVVPNPFTSFATLPGHEAERFSLYDISGRKVGIFKGDRIGSGLSAGVYFLRPQEGKAKPVRVVKVR